MTKWVLELSKYQVDFQPRKAMNTQVQADFTVENTLLSVIETFSTLEQLDPKRAWVLYVDSSVSQHHKGAGFVLEDAHDIEFAYTLKYNFPVSNNELEYEAILAGL